MDVHLLFRAWLGIQWYEHDQMVLPHEIMQIDQIFASIFHGEYNWGGGGREERKEKHTSVLCISASLWRL